MLSGLNYDPSMENAGFFTAFRITSRGAFCHSGSHSSFIVILNELLSEEESLVCLFATKAEDTKVHKEKLSEPL